MKVIVCARVSKSWCELRASFRLAYLSDNSEYFVTHKKTKFPSQANKVQAEAQPQTRQVLGRRSNQQQNRKHLGKTQKEGDEKEGPPRAV